MLIVVVSLDDTVIMQELTQSCCGVLRVTFVLTTRNLSIFRKIFGRVQCFPFTVVIDNREFRVTG